jgi:hypothetical protein
MLWRVLSEDLQLAVVGKAAYSQLIAYKGCDLGLFGSKKKAALATLSAGVGAPKNPVLYKLFTSLCI